MKRAGPTFIALCMLLLANVVRAEGSPGFAGLLTIPALPAPGQEVTLVVNDHDRLYPPSAEKIRVSRVEGNGAVGVAVTTQSVAYWRAFYSLGSLPPGRYYVEYYDTPSVPEYTDTPKFTAEFTVSVHGPLTVVEYFNATLAHYFIASDPDEIQRLDGGTIAGWQRTGETFRAIPVAEMPSFGLPVCRFYGLPEAGLDSHFFTADAGECAAVRSRWPDKWVLEAEAAFGVVSVFPYECEDAFRPVYRLYNNRPDANHRYTVSAEIRDRMVAQGWIEEDAQVGYDRLSMCVPG